MTVPAPLERAFTRIEASAVYFIVSGDLQPGAAVNSWSCAHDSKYSHSVLDKEAWEDGASSFGAGSHSKRTPCVMFCGEEQLSALGHSAYTELSTQQKYQPMDCARREANLLHRWSHLLWRHFHS